MRCTPGGFRHGLWKLVLGTWLYWLIGNFFTKAAASPAPPATIAREEPIVEPTGSDGGFEYSDAYLHDNDARFVFNFIRAALNYGCIAANYVESLGSQRGAGGTWVTRARDLSGGARRRSSSARASCSTPAGRSSTRSTCTTGVDDRAQARVLEGHPPASSTG